MLTPLAAVMRARNLMTGRTEVWEARSECGRWYFERWETAGTPWAVTYVPTDQVQWFGTLRRARAWTASDDALLDLRRAAQDVVDRQGTNPSLVGTLRDDPADCAARVAEARQRVELLDRLIAGPKAGTA